MHRVTYQIPYVPYDETKTITKPYVMTYEIPDSMPYVKSNKPPTLSYNQFMIYSHLFIWPNDKNPFFRAWARDDTRCEDPRPLYLISILQHNTNITWDEFLNNPFYFMFSGVQVHQKVFVWAYSDIVQRRFQTPSRAESVADLDRMAASFLKMSKKEIGLGHNMRKNAKHASLPLLDDPFPSFYAQYFKYEHTTKNGVNVIRVKDDKKSEKSYAMYLASHIPFNRESCDKHKPYIHVRTYVINTIPNKNFLLIL